MNAMDVNEERDEIPFDPPHYGPELPEWWQLALAGYEVACHLPDDWDVSESWQPERPPQLNADWFLVAAAYVSIELHEHDDGSIDTDYIPASYWARRPRWLVGPTERTFTKVHRWAMEPSMARRFTTRPISLLVYQGNYPEVSYL